MPFHAFVNAGACVYRGFGENTARFGA